MIQYEQNLLSLGCQHIAGVDEVGRGCWAGPMVIAAVIIRNNDILNPKNPLWMQIKDSKVISAKKRQQLSTFLMSELHYYSIMEISPEEIDKSGISACTKKGFLLAVNNLPQKPDHILTDAFKIPDLTQTIQTNIIKGDSKSLSIAAASIIAKVYRDNLMTRMGGGEKYSQYRFDKHKGYGTKLHRNLLEKHGISDMHRLSFEPMKSMPA